MNTTSSKAVRQAFGPTCKHHDGERCTNALALPLYGERPSPGVCGICEHYRGLPRGLGDVVERVARVFGIDKAAKAVERATGRECGCAERRRALNEKFPNSANAPLDVEPK